MYLSEPYDSSNIFSRILKKELPCEQVYEDSYSLAFLDLYPQSKGHVLIIPKQEAQNILDISTDYLTHLIQLVQKLSKTIESCLKPDGLIIKQFNGSEAGQTVSHFHFHIIPVYKNTGLKSHAHDKQQKIEDLQLLSKKIRTALMNMEG